MKTVIATRTEIKASIWAAGEQENLVTQHNQHFQDGLAEIAKWCDDKQERNVNIISFADTRFKNGMTVVDKPHGVIQRVYTVVNDRYDDPVFYRQTDWPEPEAWARNLYTFEQPLNVGVPKLPFGFMYPSSELDSTCGRGRTGIYAFDDDKIYIAPWIQSNEFVVIEWTGIKTSWGDYDQISDDLDYRKCLKLWMQYMHEFDFGSMDKAFLFHNVQKTGLFDEALADLMWQARERTKVQPFKQSPEERATRLDQTADDVDPVINTIFAQIANIGSGGSDVEAVATLVKDWSPMFIIGAGNIGATSDYDAVAGLHFHDFIAPYTGAYSPGTINAFWPCPGDTDWAIDSTLAAYKSFFAAASSRYYEFAVGNVHVFMLDSNALEADGITSGSTQGAWLMAKLALSTAPFKIVVLYDAPYSSTLSHATLQWPFVTWGADLVISGSAKNYERLSVGGLTYINNGLGGNATREAIGSPIGSSLATYSAAYGALKLEASATTLTYSFYSAAGTLIETGQISA